MDLNAKQQQLEQQVAKLMKLLTPEVVEKEEGLRCWEEEKLHFGSKLTNANMLQNPIERDISTMCATTDFELPSANEELGRQVAPYEAQVGSQGQTITEPFSQYAETEEAL